MFQFTREFIINDNGTGVPGTKGLLKDGKRFELTTDNKTLMVARMTNIEKAHVASVSKMAGRAAVNEEVTIVPSVTVAADSIVRLVITIRQQGRVTALVNDYHPIHKKQYFYEAVVKTANTLPLADFAKIAAKEEAAAAPDALIHVAEDEGSLVISALDPYTRIDEVRIVSVPKAQTGAAESLTGYMDYDVLVLWQKEEANPTGCTASLTAGDEGAGTVAQILKNMRLLTDANIDPFGFDVDERPVPGAIYDQYLVEYVTEVRHIGSQVFGAIDHSLTSFVFFVRHEAGDSGLTKAWETALGALATIETVTVNGQAPVVANAKTLPDDIMATKADAEAAAASVEVPTKATLPAESVDGTNPTTDIELDLH